MYFKLMLVSPKFVVLVPSSGFYKSINTTEVAWVIWMVTRGDRVNLKSAFIVTLVINF